MNLIERYGEKPFVLKSWMLFLYFENFGEIFEGLDENKRDLSRDSLLIMNKTTMEEEIKYKLIIYAKKLFYITLKKIEK